MKTLYIDCSMGAAGDMLTAALLELLPSSDREAFVAKLNSLGIPGVKYSTDPSVKCGITGTHMRVTVDGEEEDEHLHGHDHEHDHEVAAHIIYSAYDTFFFSDLGHLLLYLYVTETIPYSITSRSDR